MDTVVYRGKGPGSTVSLSLSLWPGDSGLLFDGGWNSSKNVGRT